MMVAEIKMSFISKVFPLRLRRSNPSTPTREERLVIQSLFLFIACPRASSRQSIRLIALPICHKSMHRQNKTPDNKSIIRGSLYSKPGSNRHGHYWPQDFKSGVSTYSTIRATAFLSVRHGKSSKIISMCIHLIYIFRNLFYFRGVKPLNFFVSPKPGEVSFGISAGVALNEFDGLIARNLAVEVVKHLAVANRLQRVQMP